MPAPKGPVTLLAEALSAMPALSGFAKVLPGIQKLAASRSPPSIVLFPVEAGYQAPHDNVQSLVDIDLKLAAHLWASSLDEAWDLRVRFIEALKQQAIGNPTAPIDATPSQAGVFYQLLTEKWDIDPDTAAQGTELEVLFAARFTASPTLQLGDGEILDTALHGTHTALGSALTSSATSMTVDSTTGFTSTGELSVGSEKITYTGLTATTFTGLTRGYNGTTAAAHAIAATVTQ